MNRTKAAGELLSSSKAIKDLAEQRKALKVTLGKLAKQTKKAAREARKLKAKASKVDLAELMQMMVMKAYIVGEEEKAKSSQASSSTDPWVPKDAKEAFEKIHTACTEDTKLDVAAFANLLRSEA